MALSLYGGGSYQPDETITLEVYMGDEAKSSIRLYRILNPEKVLLLGGPANFEGSDELSLELIRHIPIKQEDYYYQQVDIGRLPIGLYYAQAGQGETASATLILVTNLGMVVKADADKILSYTANLTTGEPLSAKVYILEDKKVVSQLESNAEGITQIAYSAEGDLILGARSQDSWAFSSSYWRRWNLTKSKLYLQTDRSIYRPGHQVFFKGILRSPSGLRPLADKEVDVIIRDAEYNEIFRQNFSTDTYGSFNGEISLRAEPPLGSYEIEAIYDGESHYSNFRVEEFQKPEYRVTVGADKAYAIQGDSATFVIKAEYLFGGAVSGGKVYYSVIKQPYYRYRYVSSYGFYEDYDYSYSYGGEMIDRGEGLLNADGELIVQIPLPKADEDYQLSLEAGVTDEARREISASGKLIAYRANLSLGISTDRYAYKVGESAKITVQAEDLEGNPVSMPFSIKQVRYSWSYETGRLEEDFPVIEGSTDKDGKAVIELPMDSQGSYDLIVSASDVKGRETSASDYLWVSGNSRWYWAYDSLNIHADKEEYAAGDTARFVIESPVTDAYILITHEGNSLSHYELIKLDGSVYTYELPITAEMSPNGYIGVSVIADGDIYYETAGYKVPPSNKFLTLEFSSDKDVYRPGESASFEVKLQDAQGQGVAAQLTVALVDEAIFLLAPDRTPDIRGFFYALKDNLVGTQLSSWYYFGQAERLAEAAMASGVAPQAMDASVFAQAKSEGFAEAELREDFRDTILWLPSLETDSNGHARVEVTLPDNLTEWRLTARAISLGDQVGQGSYSIKTSLPVITRLATPRFLVRGDEASLRVIAQSNLESDTEAKLSLTSIGLSIAAPDVLDRNLAAKQRSSADFNVQALETGLASLTATVLTPSDSDAMKIPLPILAHGVKDGLSWAGSGSSTWNFNLPSNVDPNSISGELVLSPSLLAAVSPALSYLAGYPYGCTEQTMSRFLPSVLAAQAGDLALLPEDIEANLEDIVAKGLKRLYTFQHGDGGWGFWENDSSDPFITAYVLSGFYRAQQAGYELRDWVIENGLEFLNNFVHSNETYSSYRHTNDDARAFAYYALALYGRDISGIEALEPSSYGMALRALSFGTLGKMTEANVYLDELLAELSERDSTAYWQADAARYYWSDDSIQTTAYGLQALAMIRPEDARLAKVVNWLLLERKGSAWVSTKDTAAVVGAALVLAAQTGESASDIRAEVLLNGQSLERFDLAGQSKSVKVSLTAVTGDNQLEIQTNSDKPLYLSGNISYVAEYDSIPIESEHFMLSRSFERLEPHYNESESRYTYERQPLTDLKVGDYVLVTVKIKPKENYRYVLVEEPLAAGFSVVEQDTSFRIGGLSPRYGYDYYGWNYWYDGRDIRDERIDYYFSYLNNPVEFTYILRAETPGHFSALPSHAWLMYEPEVRGVGNDMRIRILPDMP
ncbi:MAG: MG2 domain-containing protein [Deinococcales bacterium]